MSLPTVCSTNKAGTSNSNSPVFILKPDCFLLINDSKYKEKLARKNNTYLNIDTMQKMIQRFFTERNMSKERLARALRVTVRDLEQIFSPGDLSRLIPRINMPLIRLYCKTKWARS